MSETVNTTVLIQTARIVWPILFEPAPPPMNPNADPKYSCALGWADKDTAKQISSAILACLTAKFDAQVAADIMELGAEGMPLKSCSNATNDTLKSLSVFYCNASATVKVPPKVYDQHLKPVIDPQLIYGGCWVNAQVNAYAWTFGSKRGASIGLKMLQLIKGGDPIGNAPQRAEDVFKPIAAPAAGPDVGDGPSISNLSDLLD